MISDTRLTFVRHLEPGDTIVETADLLTNDVVVVDVEIAEPFAFVRVKDAGTFRARWRLALDERVRIVNR